MIGAIDIGGTKIAAAAVDRGGRVLAVETCPTEPARGFEDALTRMVGMLRCCASEAGQSLEGIGIGCTGPVDPIQGRVGDVPFLPGWLGAELAGRLAAAFGVTAALENDADAHALGEYQWGAGRSSRRFIMITVGTGIGGSLLIDGELYRGAGGAHPEFGHQVLEPAGPLCPCGARGCWESLASGPALAVGYAAEHPERRPLTAKEICEAAERGEPEAQAAVERLGTYLGLGLANLVTVFAPDRIALGGGLMRSAHLFRAPMTAALEANARLIPPGTHEVVPSAFGTHAGVIGAASVWLHRYGHP